MFKPLISMLLAVTLAATTATSPAFAAAANSPSASSDATQKAPEQRDEPSAEHSLCSKGIQQSPINIDTAYPYAWQDTGSYRYRKVAPPRLRFVMYPTPLQVTRDPYGIKVHDNGGSYARIDLQRYDLTGIRFHSPSEHLINGHRYPAELQLIHQHQGDLAIFSVFIKEGGAAHRTLTEILDNTPDNVGETKTYRKRRIDTALLLPGSKGFYVYNGSLSIPPCSEQARRFVMKQPIFASRQQILALRGLLGDNARPVQEIGERKVLQTLF